MNRAGFYPNEPGSSMQESMRRVQARRPEGRPGERNGSDEPSAQNSVKPGGLEKVMVSEESKRKIVDCVARWRRFGEAPDVLRAESDSAERPWKKSIHPSWPARVSWARASYLMVGRLVPELVLPAD